MRGPIRVERWARQNAVAVRPEELGETGLVWAMAGAAADSARLIQRNSGIGTRSPLTPRKRNIAVPIAINPARPPRTPNRRRHRAREKKVHQTTRRRVAMIPITAVA